MAAGTSGPSARIFDLCPNLISLVSLTAPSLLENQKPLGLQWWTSPLASASASRYLSGEPPRSRAMSLVEFLAELGRRRIPLNYAVDDLRADLPTLKNLS